MGRQKDRRSPAGPAKAPTYKVLNALLAGMPDAVEGRVRTALATRIAAAEASGQPSAELCDDLASGAQALALAEATREQIEHEEPELLDAIACTSGCAWCCIFLEGDGGLISEAEAVALHTALSPFAGTADGRDWHPEACAALDPATRLCRAYDARPMICRTFVSTDAGACRENAEGGDADGSGTIGSHVDYRPRPVARGTEGAPQGQHLQPPASGHRRRRRHGTGRVPDRRPPRQRRTAPHLRGLRGFDLTAGSRAAVKLRSCRYSCRPRSALR